MLFDVNKYTISNLEFWMMLQLTYRRTCYVQMLKLMYTFHFIGEVDLSMVNEVNVCRFESSKKFLEYQCENLAKRIKGDADLIRKIAKLQTKKFEDNGALESRKPCQS